jgi:hypothetical protein
MVGTQPHGRHIAANCGRSFDATGWNWRNLSGKPARSEFNTGMLSSQESC